MTVPALTLARLTGSPDRAQLPLLVLGPSLGTSASALWGECAAAGLTDRFDVVAWDLPGHGHNQAVPEEPFTMAELASGVLRVLDDVQEQREDLGGSFHYAGNSVGGAVGLHLLLDHPGRVRSAALLCTGARIGEPSMWADRVAQVAVSGTSGQVDASAQRWFAPDFLDRSPERGSALLGALADVDDRGYTLVCAALADFDLRDRLGDVTAPVLAIAGAHDLVTPVEGLRLVAEAVKDGRLVVLDDVAHLAPAETPDRVARMLSAHFLGEPMSEQRPARPGLDRRSRSMITLTALLARGQHEELAVQARAALRHGLTVEEIKEVLLQSAIDLGVPDTDAAIRSVQLVLDEETP